jgi:hypothetical protein
MTSSSTSDSPCGYCVGADTIPVSPTAGSPSSANITVHGDGAKCGPSICPGVPAAAAACMVPMASVHTIPTVNITQVNVNIPVPETINTAKSISMEDVPNEEQEQVAKQWKKKTEKKKNWKSFCVCVKRFLICFFLFYSLVVTIVAIYLAERARNIPVMEAQLRASDTNESRSVVEEIAQFDGCFELAGYQEENDILHLSMNRFRIQDGELRTELDSVEEIVATFEDQAAVPKNNAEGGEGHNCLNLEGLEPLPASIMNDASSMNMTVHDAFGENTVPWDLPITFGAVDSFGQPLINFFNRDGTAGGFTDVSKLPCQLHC